MIKKLMNELDEGYSFANEVCDTTDVCGMELYRIMNATIEQYRREQMKKLIPKMGNKTILELGKGEPHLNLRGSLQERLMTILNNDGNFLIYID